MEHQELSLWESLLDLFVLNPLGIIGFILLAGILLWTLKGKTIGIKIQTSLLSFLLFYYLLVSLTNIFGITTIQDLSRFHSLGENLYNPNIELVPLADGFSLSFILNIVVFLPIGFLIPFISPSFRHIGKTLLAGGLFSLAIEISQLFSLYRATDINDLLTNTLGTFIGYLCFLLFAKLFFKKKQQPVAKDRTNYLPTAILLISFLTVSLLF